MALLDFCVRGKRNVRALHVNHGTEFSATSQRIVERYCSLNKIELSVHRIDPGGAHTEESWRDERLKAYSRFTRDGYVATAHHLGDVVEWYLLTALHGKPALMKAVDDQHGLIKPFLGTQKGELIRWCDDRRVEYVTDPTNVGEDNSRAVLWAHVLPNLLKIHPGFHSTIRNKLLEAVQ